MPGIWISDALPHKSFGAVELPFEVGADESGCVHSQHLCLPLFSLHWPLVLWVPSQALVVLAVGERGGGVPLHPLCSQPLWVLSPLAPPLGLSLIQAFPNPAPLLLLALPTVP